MAAQIRPNRLEVTDRFPMLGFTIRTDGSAQRAEIAIATDPTLLQPGRKGDRTLSNFYSSRASGPLAIPRGEAVYVVPPEVLARFIGQERLYVGLATAAERNGGTPHVEVMPTEGSPYISLKGLTGRSLRRVRMLPTRQQRAAGYGANGGAAMEWAGDAATPGTVPVTAGNGSKAGATNGGAKLPPPPAAVEYDDGFGPLAPPPAESSAPAAPASNGGTAAPAAVPSATPAAGTPPPTAVAKALDLSGLLIGTDRSPVASPSLTRLPSWQATLAQGALATLAGPLAPVVATLPAAARAAGVSIGVGPAVGAGLGAGVGLGIGVVFGPDGGVGVYGAAEFEVGFLASISATAQITVVRGGLENFNGWGMAASISGGEGIVGGASALFDLNGNFQGVSFQLGVGAGLTPVDFYIAVQRQMATQLALAQARARNGVLTLGRIAQPSRYVPSQSSSSGLVASRELANAALALASEIPLDPGNGGMSIGPDVLEIGDIILSTTAAGVSGAIRFATGSDVSHAMLYVGQGGQVVDATSAGVRLRPLAEALSDASLAVAFRYPGLSSDQRQIIADKAAEYIGRPYNYWGIVRQARFQVHRTLCDALPDAAASACRNFAGRVDLGRGNSSEFFCSELIVAAYQAAGVPITDTPPIWSSPDDLAQLALRQGALAYVGHLKAPPYERRESIWDALGFSLSAALTPPLPTDDRAPRTTPRTSTARAAASGLGLVQALDTERRPARFPTVRTASAVEKEIALAAITVLSPTTSALILALRAVANRHNVSIGIGPSASVGFLIGGGVGAGIIFAPGDHVGFYGQFDLRGGFIDSASLELQCTIVRGGIESFGGISWALAVEVDAGVSVSGQALFDTSLRFQGVTFGLGVGLGVEPIQVFLALQGSYAESLASAPAGGASGARVRPLAAESFTLNWDEVQAIAQPTNFSCWAAAAAMVVGWRDRVSLNPDSIAEICGRTTATGLDPAQVGQLATELGLVAEPPQSYSVDGFRRLLENNGPLWVAASVPGLHAIVVTGLYGEGDSACVRITDPWDRQVGTPGAPGRYLKTHATGSRYIMRWEDFVREYEAAATDYSRVNLQILHSDGAIGRTPNYGSAASAGYAQALRAARAMARPSSVQRYATQHADDTTAEIAAAPQAPVRRRDVGSLGSVRWTLDQYQGLRWPAGAAPNGGNSVAAERAVRLDDWPLVHLAEGDVQLPLTVSWRYKAGAVGDLAIRPGAPRTIAGWTLATTADITDGPDTSTAAALTVNVRQAFGRNGRSDIVGVTQLTLFGDGTYQRQDRWEQAEAGAA